jgi:hypothetical protein
MMSRKEGVVSVWVANFGSAVVFSAYFAENDEDNLSLNQFAADFQLGNPPRYWYDHDRQEAGFEPSGPLPVGQLVAEASHSTSFLFQVVQAATVAGWKEADGVILLFDYAVVGEMPRPEGPARYIGTFKYEADV